MFRKSIAIYPESNANIGDRILFKRQEFEIEGVVVSVREKTVIIEISKEDSLILSLENNRTVVKHSNYLILERNSNKENYTYELALHQF